MTPTQKPTPTRRALVVGLGIAGMATATRLHEIGWEVTVVERSTTRRTGGYFVAMFGLGRSSAERLGILDLLPDRAPAHGTTWEIDRAGHRSPGMGFKDIPDRPKLLLRGDIENALFTRLPTDVEVRYGVTPTHLSQDGDGVDITLQEHTGARTTERYDLVIGADGIHSTVRRLTFGPDANFVRPLGYMIGATLCDRPVAGLAPGDGVILAEPGRSMWLFGFGDRDPGLLFSYRTSDPAAELRKDPGRALREAYRPEPGSGLLSDMIDRYEAAPDRLFDEAAQVTMQQWHHQRVALVGDAAWCMTLYSGLGASSGLAGGDLLGTMLERHPSIDEALASWNAVIRPYVQRQQADIGSMRTMFTPADRREHLTRKAGIRLLGSPAGRTLMDRFGSQRRQFADKNLDLAAPWRPHPSDDRITR